MPLLSQTLKTNFLMLRPTLFKATNPAPSTHVMKKRDLLMDLKFSKIVIFSNSGAA